MPHTPPETIERYFRQAATLRQCLQQNLDDYDFARRGGKIVYLVDANLVGFFLRPQEEIRHIAAFGPTAASDYGAATAVIAAEFLFSRGLAGQFDSPALIAPAHGEDLSDVVRGMQQSDSAGDLPDEPITDKTRTKLTTLLDKVSENRILPADAATQLQAIVPRYAKYLLEGVGAEATHLHRLHEKDLLRPLALHPHATREILVLDRDARKEANDWVEILVKVRPPKSPRERKKIERDAEAIVQLRLLNASAFKERPQTQYVLITADRILFDAYTNWFWGPQNNSKRFSLRMPLQYVPVLNEMEMPNGIENSNVIRSARFTLDSLFANLRSADPGYPRNLSIQRLLSGTDARLSQALEGLYGQNPLRFDETEVDLFRRIRKNWNKIFEMGIVQNAELISRRTRAPLERLAGLLRQNVDLREAIHIDQQRILANVEAIHVVFNNRINMLEIVSERKSGAGQPGRRAPLALRATFPKILPRETLDDALERIARGDTELITRIDGSLPSVPDYEASFFAACVAHRCGSWATASYFADRALEQIDQSGGSDNASVRTEIAYLMASATRYARPSRQAIEKALQLLKEILERSRALSDAFGTARALAEYTSMFLVLVYAAKLYGEQEASELVAKVMSQTSDFVARVEEALVAVQAARTDNPKSLPTLTSIETQLRANVVSAEVLVRYFGYSRDISAGLPAVRSALNALNTGLDARDVPPIIAGECMMVRLSIGEITRAAARAELAMLIQSFEASGKALDLDRVEFEAFTKMLEGNPNARRESSALRRAG